jgi:hypothetical protein
MVVRRTRCPYKRGGDGHIADITHVHTIKRYSSVGAEPAGEFDSSQMDPVVLFSIAARARDARPQ